MSSGLQANHSLGKLLIGTETTLIESSSATNGHVSEDATAFCLQKGLVAGGKNPAILKILALPTLLIRLQDLPPILPMEALLLYFRMEELLLFHRFQAALGHLPATILGLACLHTPV